MSSSGDADHVLRLFREMKSFRRAPDLACYTTVVHSLVAARRPHAALSVFKEMASSGWPRTPFRFGLRGGEVDGEVRVPPDVVTYSTLITGLCWAGRVEEALGVLDLMLEDQCRPNVRTYTPIVHAYCSIGRIEEAKQLANAMGAVGCPPNTVTYNVIVEALCTVGALDEVGNLINDSVSNGWKPDAITYSIYMDGLCKFGKLDKCVEVFDEMTARGLCPTAVTLNILLDCLCRGSEAWEAKYLLERSRELEWNADVANYNTVMSRLCSGGRVLAVLKLFTDMLKKGIAPNSWTFSIVVNSLCRAGKLRKARCIFDSKGFVANIVTYTTLIRYLHLAGENDEVCLLFYKMVEENISPNHTIYRIMIDCLCTKGRFLVAIGCFLGLLRMGTRRIWW
uniref:Pentatricopeptide repeat-containing protein n=1 Tax=Ananas comosus var. bracteatus TaxID=296719 RepID=A0A6V7PRU0_ANACO|nr:unnamed protein product [Ananas comosus var. bracteatus]